MDERGFAYFRPGVKNGEALELPYAPWPMWGQPQWGFISANPLPTDRREVTYEGWVRFARSPFIGTGAFQLRPESFASGDSPILLPSGFEFAGSTDGTGPAFTFQKGVSGRLSHLHFPRINAPTIDIAMSGVENIANQLIWTLTASSNHPVFVDAILIRSTDLAEIRERTIAGGPDASLEQVGSMLLHPSIRPFVSQYVEGVRSSSPFYGFLCYFKICERMNDVRPKLRKIFSNHQLEPPVLNGTFPADPIGLISKAMVGEKYTVAIAKYQPEYRNGIAHFNPAERLEPLVEKQNERAVTVACSLMRWAASDLISQTIDALRLLERWQVDLGGVRLG